MKFLWLLLLLPLAAWAQDDIALRQQEIQECRAGELSTWADGRDQAAVARRIRFAYEHAGAPAWLSREQVLQALRLAASSWSRCGVVTGEVVAGSGQVRVVWSEAGSRGNFGLADVGRRTLALGPAAFALLQQRNPPATGQTLQMVVSHEMGHFFGLMAHSRRCVDVMSYYGDGKGNQCRLRSGTAPRPGIEYRALLPTACDIQRCVAANPAP